MLNHNTFFKPTPLYKEFMILDLIEKNKDITQREISIQVGISVSMVNSYLEEYEGNGLVERKRLTKKTVKYYLTRIGFERKRALNISYLADSLKVFKAASSDILKFLEQIHDLGYKKIYLYGAGEVAEIILNTLSVYYKCPIKIIGIIDDDEDKHGLLMIRCKIVPLSTIIGSNHHDGVLISSFTHHEQIKQKLLDINYPTKKILDFFNQ